MPRLFVGFDADQSEDRTDRPGGAGEGEVRDGFCIEVRRRLLLHAALFEERLCFSHRADRGGALAHPRHQVHTSQLRFEHQIAEARPAIAFLDTELLERVEPLGELLEQRGLVVVERDLHLR